MNGTLTIEGPLDALSTIASDLNKQFPYGITVEVAPKGDIGGWTADAARILYTGLAARQRQALELLVKNNGYADGVTLRKTFGNDTGQIRGLTGPISKRVNKLISQGTLPEGTEAPTTTEYDPDNLSFQRAGGIRMSADLVPIFRDAIGG